MLLARRADELARSSEWYHSLLNHLRHRIACSNQQNFSCSNPYVWRLLLPGHSPRMAYRLASSSAGVRLKKRASARASTWSPKRDGEGDYSAMLDAALPGHAK